MFKDKLQAAPLNLSPSFEPGTTLSETFVENRIHSGKVQTVFETEYSDM